MKFRVLTLLCLSMTYLVGAGCARSEGGAEPQAPPPSPATAPATDSGPHPAEPSKAEQVKAQPSKPHVEALLATALAEPDQRRAEEAGERLTDEIFHDPEAASAKVSLVQRAVLRLSEGGQYNEAVAQRVALLQEILDKRVHAEHERTFLRDGAIAAWSSLALGALAGLRPVNRVFKRVVERIAPVARHPSVAATVAEARFRDLALMRVRPSDVPMDALRESSIPGVRWGFFNQIGQYNFGENRVFILVVPMAKTRHSIVLGSRQLRPDEVAQLTRRLRPPPRVEVPADPDTYNTAAALAVGLTSFAATGSAYYAGFLSGWQNGLGETFDYKALLSEEHLDPEAK